MVSPFADLIRLAFFAGVLVLLALAEIALPRRSWRVHKPPRWLSNLALVILNTLTVRLLLPVGAVGIALFAEERSWGALHQLDLPSWLRVVLAVVALDFLIYLQHVVFHAVPALWRLHMVHHADLDFDVTTGLRFHTIEIVLSMGIKLTAIVLLGAPALAVLIFEVLLNATSMFSHANVRLPIWLDRMLRCVLVTPDMHRVHHSVMARETNSNFGFNLPWWDFLLGTYRAQPAQGHEAMAIGLSQMRDERRADRLDWMLALPFVGQQGDYAINRRGDGQKGEFSPKPAAALEQRDVALFLFVCVENSCRSQMAEAFVRKHGHGAATAFSAGIRPSGQVHPKAIACMRERDYDLCSHRSKDLGEIPDLDFDVVVSMGCGDLSGRVHAKGYVAWDLPAPKNLPLGQVRAIRDQIEMRVQELLAEWEAGHDLGLLTASLP